MDAPQRLPWVFLRGLTRGSAHWGSFISEFEAQLPAQVIALDLPGNGRLWQKPSPTRVADLVQHCQAELRRRGIDQPVGLLALSLGGMVAMQWALEQPASVRELVLINTSARPLHPFWQRLRPAAWWAVARLLLTRADALAWEREILRLTSQHARQDVLQDWYQERLQHPVSAANALRQLVAAARYRAPRQAPLPPTLVLCGAADRLVAPQCSQTLAALWGSRLRLHPSAGHDLTLDAGPWVAEQVRQWSAD